MVNTLINNLPTGMSKSKPESFNKLKIRSMNGGNGRIYDITISVKDTGKKIELFTNVVVVDLNLLMKDEFPYPKTYHAVFLKNIEGDTLETCTSWGFYDPP